MAFNVVHHFAIHADDLDRAQRFYSTVFGWRFEAWGPPDFFNVYTGDVDDPGIAGALEKRHAPLTAGSEETRGFTCTISVADIGLTRDAIRRAGGTIRYDGAIPTVGKIITFLDSEGNHVSAMQYEPQHVKSRRPQG